MFVPSATAANPTVELVAPGEYSFFLDVWDENNVKSCEPGIIEVSVVPADR